MSGGEARHRVNLVSGHSDCLFIELLLNCEAGLALPCVIFSKFFYFFFKSLEKMFSTNVLFSGEVFEGVKVTVKVNVGDYNLPNDVVKLGSEEVF